jgi:hypothetical protein
VTIASNAVVHEEGLRHGGGIGEAGRFHDDAVELVGALHEPCDDAHQIAAHGAADAAVVHLEDFLVRADDEIVVDVGFAEFVDDDRVFPAVVLGEDAVEERGLAGAQIAGQHGDGNLAHVDPRKKARAAARPIPRNAAAPVRCAPT